MTIEERDLLFKDLCSRLPYVVRGVYKTPGIEITSQKLTYDIIGNLEYKNNVEFKPYLFPLSSMTEEQLFEVQSILGKNEIEIEDGFLRIVDSCRNTISYLEIFALLEWFNKNHFDYRGLIPMGLANDATGLNIY